MAPSRVDSQLVWIPTVAAALECEIDRAREYLRLLTGVHAARLVKAKAAAELVETLRPSDPRARLVQQRAEGSRSQMRKLLRLELNREGRF